MRRMRVRLALGCALAVAGCQCFVPVADGFLDGGGGGNGRGGGAGGAGGTGGGGPAGCVGNQVALTATVGLMIDEEFTTWARPRVHLRDDARACGGRGAVRTLSDWDFSGTLGLKATGSATVRFRYNYGWDGYGGPARTVSLHQVTSAWDGGAAWASAPAFDVVPLGSATLSPVVGTTVEFPVPAALVQGWIDDPSRRHGVLFKFLSETCPSPRWPAEFDAPVLVIPCG